MARNSFFCRGLLRLLGLPWPPKVSVLSTDPGTGSEKVPKYLSLTGAKAKDLANLLHVSQPTISRALALLQLPAEVQEQVSEGTISPTAGAEIARIKNPTVARKVAIKAAESRAPVAEVQRAVRQRQGVPAKPTPFTQFKLERGCRVVVHGKLPGEQIIDGTRAGAGTGTGRAGASRAGGGGRR